jgi:hypothetical protein
LQYCNTDLDDNKTILAVTHNDANEPEDTENSDSANEVAFIKVTHPEGKETLETAVHYIQQQKESTPRDVILIKRWIDDAACKGSSSLQQRNVTKFFK